MLTNGEAAVWLVADWKFFWVGRLWKLLSRASTCVVWFGTGFSGWPSVAPVLSVASKSQSTCSRNTDDGLPNGWRVARRLPRRPPLHCLVFVSAAFLLARRARHTRLRLQTDGRSSPGTDSPPPNRPIPTSILMRNLTRITYKQPKRPHQHVLTMVWQSNNTSPSTFPPVCRLTQSVNTFPKLQHFTRGRSRGLLCGSP